MNKRIKIYCTILAVIYVLIMGYNVYKVVQGFAVGVSIANKDHKTAKSSQMYHFKVQAKNGMASFPEVYENKQTGVITKMEATEYMLMVESPKRSITGDIFSLAKGFGALILLAAAGVFPFIFFSIIKSVTRNQILDKSVIVKIRFMGWFLIAVGIYSFVLYTIDYFWAKHFLNGTDYTAILDFSEYTTLILGIVTLMLGEILNISLQLKEDQDLTI